MAKSGMQDTYANKAYGTVTESGATTLTFSEIQTNVNIFTKVAWIISRIEWYLTPATYALVLTGDSLEMALTASDGIASLSLGEPSVIDKMILSRLEASNVGFIYFDMPMIRDFSTMPGGGLIIAPRPLYVAAEGTGTAAACTVQCRFFFRQIEMKAEEYLDLIDFYRIVS